MSKKNPKKPNPKKTQQQNKTQKNPNQTQQQETPIESNPETPIPVLEFGIGTVAPNRISLSAKAMM